MSVKWGIGTSPQFRSQFLFVFLVCNVRIKKRNDGNQRNQQLHCSGLDSLPVSEKAEHRWDDTVLKNRPQHNVWSSPSDRGLSPSQITPSNYGRIAESLWESSSELHVSLRDTLHEEKKAGKQWSNVGKWWVAEKMGVCGWWEIKRVKGQEKKAQHFKSL